MLLDKGYHLTYCTNIHPGETWEEVFRSLIWYLPGLKQKLSPDKPFGIGLRLSNVASKELLEDKRLKSFKQWLDENGLYVFTMNGFPYGSFHHRVVKDHVHQPDWTTCERVAYTVRLAQILAVLLPEGMEGGISTSPLSYKPWYKDKQDELEQVYSTSTDHLIYLVEELQKIKERTGKTIHIDIEPEPDGLLENTEEVIDFYENWLLPAGSEKLVDDTGTTEEEAVETILRHIQLCYDVCHFALAYERPATTFARMKEAGIRIGKIQLSAALKVLLPESEKGRKELAEELAPFAESTYLHQVVQRNRNKTLTHYPDLPQALQHIQQHKAREWRTHFHVPLFTDSYHRLRSTQDDIKAVLNLLQKEHITDHLEVETYTWEVLPEDMKKDLSESIQRELEWVIENISNKQHAENGSTERSRTHEVTDW